MNDKLFLGVLIYIFTSVLFIGVLPDSFFSGSRPNVPDDLTDGIDSPTSITQQTGYISKIITFAFVPFKISGIPVFLALIIFFINIFTTLISVIYIYDKIRGIGG